MDKELAGRMGLRIKQARQQRGLSQVQLGKAVGLEGGSTISMIERGERNPSTRTLSELARVLEVSSAWLIDGVTPPGWTSGRRPEASRYEAPLQRAVRSFEPGGLDPLLLVEVILELNEKSPRWVNGTPTAMARALTSTYRELGTRQHRGTPDSRSAAGFGGTRQNAPPDGVGAAYPRHYRQMC